MRRRLIAVVIVVFIIVAILVYALAPRSSSGSGGGSSIGSVTVTDTVTYSLTQQETLSAGGSSFVNPIMQQWIYGYSDLMNAKVVTNYIADGSGAGITGILQNTFAFAGSDAPVPPDDLNVITNNTLLQIPETMGGVAIFYYIPGINNATLKFTAPVLAGIWNESISMWNAPQIAALNPNVPLPDHPIIPVHRSDGSGTTYAFTTYLSKTNPDWNTTVGVGTSVNWPANELGGVGSGGIAATVSETPYSIGYVDTYYVINNPGLTIGEVQNSAGNFEMPNLTTVANAAAAFSAQVLANPTFSITNAPGANSYPISTYTYILVWKDQTNQAQGDAMATFFWWVIHQGQALSPKLGYPVLPAGVVAEDEGLIEEMNYNGQAFIQGS